MLGIQNAFGENISELKLTITVANRQLQKNKHTASKTTKITDKKRNVRAWTEQLDDKDGCTTRQLVTKTD